MKVLIIGGGGREHALAYKAAMSEIVDTVYIAPGNAGTALEDKVQNVKIAADDIENLLAFALENEVTLTIVGPEQPLVLGVVDLFEANNLAIFGPSKAAAQLEGSKSFSKDFLAKYDIPTADYKTFTNVNTALAYLQKRNPPFVIKADGLAAGKGVVIAKTKKEANATVRDMLSGNKFGKAGNRIVIEEFLDGEEASFIVMVDGKNILPFATSQDHKRAFDNDEGPNTGGMGAYSPAPVVTQEVYDKVMAEIIEPTVNGMIADGTPYKGFLYAGLMIDTNGQPKVIEYNCRFGDPETQPIMMRLDSDLVQLCLQACKGQLDKESIEFNTKPALGVVLAAGGYPGEYEIANHIVGLEHIEKDKNTKVFHAGTAIMRGTISACGGRILCVTSLGWTIEEAQTSAYNNIRKITCKGSFYRKDIGNRAIGRPYLC